MRYSSRGYTVGKIASVLGILQGAAWAIMSLAAIIIYNWAPDLDEPTTYSKLIEAQLYNHFMGGTSSSSVQFIIRPHDFTIIMWVYFILSVGWTALSLDLFYSVTLIVSLIDLILVCLLSRDYSVCNDVDENLASADSYYCYLAVGIVMTVAARGYTLWLINLIFSFNIIYVAANIIKEDSRFGPVHIPRVKVPQSDTTGSFSRHLDLSLRPPFFQGGSFPKREDDFNRPNGLPTFQTSSQASPNRFSRNQSEPELPSFLSRGDKFTY
ncbi:hypothetical protein NQ317_019941 [Molorchus minor]|uniref:Uncharacterized protein n=1 Tax=Molorchus minor TaxID=1323400 RepID=A0ABQ9K6A8_9CUCU|nr:hypothetical protein NQ317_019941 [Molorchus minor]